MTTPIIFERLIAKNGKHIGLISLNVEKTLNALTLEMVDLLLMQLNRWQHQQDLACVLIRSTSEKAFCAGGDVQALAQSARDKPGGPCAYAEDFFTREYRLDYLLHNYPKPIICWGHGIVMGGGLGIMAACSHGIATETTRIAMPEVSIGFYPDVGGSWFLNRMPSRSGLFLALTGVSINATDSLFTGLADYFIAREHYQAMIDGLLIQNWATTQQHNHDLVSDLLAVISADFDDELPPANVEPQLSSIEQLCAGDDPRTIIQAIGALQSEDAWLQKARDGLAAGSPLSALLIHRQLQISAQMTLAEVFQSELQLSTNIIRYPEFTEGVRALLIDKDRKPQWQYKTVNDVPADRLEAFFSTPSTGASWPENPLADL